MSNMKAMVYEGAGRVILEEIPLPVPKDDEVLLKIDYCGICGSDMGVRKGTHPRAKAPLVLGHEFLGKLAGDGKRFKKGDRVVCYPLLQCGRCLPCRTGNEHVCDYFNIYGTDCDGGMAEYAAVIEDKLFQVPDGVSDRAAVLCEPLAVVVHSMFIAGLKPLDTVVITGAGPIGCLTGIVALHLGASKVWISDIAPKRLEKARELGMLPVNLKEENLEQIVKAATDGEGCDVLVECSGSQAAIADATKITRVKGTICLTAVHGEPHLVDLRDINFKEQTLVGSRVYTKEQFGRAVQLTTVLQEKLEKIVSDIIPIEDAGDENQSAKCSAFDLIADPDSDTCKVVVDCRPKSERSK